MVGNVLRLLVLSEDGSREAHETVESLLTKMLRLIDSKHDPQRVTFEPTPEALVSIVRANRWKSRKKTDHRQVVALRRQIANTLAEDSGFVVFHVDGDRIWSQQASSENREKFQQQIAAQVRRLLEETQRSWSDEEIDRRMSRLCLCMPFYSIEAWLYQNTKVAIQICRDKYSGRDVDTFETWQGDRKMLDEVAAPKDRVCLAGKHNRELATRAFPHREAHDAGKSFAAAVETLADSAGLKAALAKIWPHWQREQ